MVNNYKELKKFVKENNYQATISAWSKNGNVVKINGKEIILPKTKKFITSVVEK